MALGIARAHISVGFKEEVEVQKVTEQLEQITQLAVSRCLQLETMSEEHRY